MIRTSTTESRRFAALIDIENLLIHGRRPLSIDDAALALDQVMSHLGPIQTRTAVGPALMHTHLPLIASLGGGLTLTSNHKDAADQALLEAGRAFVNNGITDLVVASGDHAFAELASIARLHVIASPSCLSRRLRVAATTVTYLHHHRASRLTAAS